MPDVVELEALEGAVENVEGEGEDVQLWRASIGETSAIAENRAGALRELANELDKKSIELAVGRDVERSARQIGGRSR